jgi:hypothetical protein
MYLYLSTGKIHGGEETGLGFWKYLCFNIFILNLTFRRMNNFSEVQKKGLHWKVSQVFLWSPFIKLITGLEQHRPCTSYRRWPFKASLWDILSWLGQEHIAKEKLGGFLTKPAHISIKRRHNLVWGTQNQSFTSGMVHPYLQRVPTSLRDPDRTLFPTCLTTMVSLCTRILANPGRASQWKDLEQVSVLGC